jgi:hypothetical protein
MTYTKKKLAWFWMVGGIFWSMIGVIISVLYWSIVEPERALDTVAEMIINTIMIPLGWIYCAMIPSASLATLMPWLSLIAFVLACRRHRIAPLYFSYAACFVFGLLWPSVFWSMMSA